MKNSAILIISALVASVLCPVVAGAGPTPVVLNYYVDCQNGNPLNDGRTLATPLLTIRDAVARARTGATINILWSEEECRECDLVIPKRLRLRGESQDVVIRCDPVYLDSAIFQIAPGADGTTIENLSLAIKEDSVGGVAAMITHASMSLVNTRVYFDGVPSKPLFSGIQVAAPIQELNVVNTVGDGFPNFVLIYPGEVDDLLVAGSTLVAPQTSFPTRAVRTLYPWESVSGVIRDSAFHGYQWHFWAEGGYINGQVKFGWNAYNGAGRYCFGGGCVDASNAPQMGNPHVCYTCEQP